MNDREKHVVNLIEKAGKTDNSVEALQFSQAALNAANALCSLRDVEPDGS